MNAVLFQNGLIVRTVETILGKAVKLPDQNDFKQLLAAVFNHLLELRAVVRLGGERTVDVVLG